MIKYAITDPSFFNTTKSKESYLKSIQNRVDYLLFRDKSSKNYKSQAIEFINLSKDYNFKKIIHQDYKLAKELNTFGVHLTSLQFSDIKKAKELGLFVVISTHSFEEIKKAQAFGADAVTFSPIFATPNKGKPKGVEALKKAVESFNIKIIALGGIVSPKHIDLIKETKAYGFASIRYFLKCS